MTLEVGIAGTKVSRKARALLNCGSQKSYGLKSVVEELGLIPISNETITHTLFGGTKTDPKRHKRYLT